MGAVLAWLVSDAGIKVAAYVAGAIWTAATAREHLVVAAERKKSETERASDLAVNVFAAVESAERSGKLDQAIAALGGDRSTAKWVRAATLFAAEWRASSGKPATPAILEVLRLVVERTALGAARRPKPGTGV